MPSFVSQLRLINLGQGGGPYLKQANIFGAPQSVQPGNYYVPGTGNPAVSTADYYHMNGLYWLRCYDLNTFGSTGQSIASSNGRYFWVTSPDHPNENFSWGDSCDFLGGYSSDPGILPSRMAHLFRSNFYSASLIDTAGQTGYGIYHTPFLVYNPDDATYPFYLYGEGSASSIQHEEGLWRSTDLVTWVKYGPTHLNSQFNDWSSYQRPVRVSSGNWYSVGFTTSNTHNLGGFGKWTSSDALSWTQVSTGVTMTVGARVFEYGASDPVTISAQTWAYVREDARSADGGMYVTRVAVDSNWNVLSSPAPVRISSAYSGVYPGPTYLQAVSVYVESGVAHIYAMHGFYTSSSAFSLADGATYSNGGGLWQENIDYYTEIVDSTAAAQSAPCGVTASCASGVVTISWLDALPNNTYRVYKGTSSGSQATLVGDVSGTSITDTPTAGQQWWYKVVTMQSGTERASRVVHTYASANSALTNQHIDRALSDGADAATIDATWIESVVSWLSSNSLTGALLHWADPAFGTKKSGSTIQKVYCIGTTRLPRGGDFTPATTNSTYSATGMNGSVPGWTNPNATDWWYFGAGRFNNIRRKTKITFVAAYKKPNTNKATFIASGQFSGIALYHASGSPGNVSFMLSDDAQTLTATKAASSATSANIVAGTFDGTNLIAYVEAVAGTSQTGLHANTDLSLDTALRGHLGVSNNQPFLGSGSQDAIYAIDTESYTFSDNEAQFSASDLIVFEDALSGSQISSLTALLRNRIGA